MRRRTTRILLVALLVVFALASAASALDAAARRAASVDLVTVPAGTLGRSEHSAVIELPIRADMLGLTWHGPAGALELRARGADGRWSQWVKLAAGDDGPDPGSAEARAARSRVGALHVAASPVWVGDAQQVQLRSSGAASARSIRVVAINATGTASASERRIGALRRSAAWVLGSAEPRAEAMPASPGIHSRETWGASPPAAPPWYADETGVLGVVVHHTAGTNRYACSQVPALLRGIQRYHMQTNGWNDIGYNFLVDACGGVWEGRAGGTTRPVGGAHTAGFNTSTSGIALIGNHAAARPTVRARDALRRLIAWRLDVAHVKPTGKMVLTAHSGDKFPVGSRVVVRAVSGHRDLYPTSCPGAIAYGELDALARDAWATGGVKVANITRSYVLRNGADPLDGSLARVVVRATGSHRDMQLNVRIEQISTNAVLHDVVAEGTVITTTWDVPSDLSIPAWDIRVRVLGTRADQRARAAVSNLVTVPPDPGFVVTTPPSGSDQIRLNYTLALEYRLGAWLYDPATGAKVASLLEPTYVGTPATPTELVLSTPPSVANGTYEMRVGLPADPATGRSMHRYAVTIAR